MAHLGRKGLRKSWLEPFEGILGHLGVIFSSNIAVALVGFATLALTSQALTPGALGLLVLFEAYARGFDALLRLEPTQALIQQGTRFRDDPGGLPFRRLVKFSLTLDIAGSLVAALVGLACLPLARHWFDFDDAGVVYAAMMCVVLLIPAPMTGTGLLRLFSRFGLYAKGLVGVAFLRLAGTGVLLLAGGGLESFVYLSVAAIAVERVLPTFLCWYTLRDRLGPDLMRTPLRGVTAAHPRLWSFIVAANLNVLARTATRRYDLIVLGGLVSPGALGLYVIAKRLAMVVIRVGGPVQLVSYPRICELVNAGEFGRIKRMIAAIGGLFLATSAVGIGVFLAVGPQLVALVFGEEYRAASNLVLIQLVGACVMLTGMVLNVTLQALRREFWLLGVSVAAALSFFLPVAFVVPQYGVTGASVLTVVMAVVWCLGAATAFALALRHPSPHLAAPNPT